nr:MAG: hypothetical protein [Porcellio scaber clopovirus]
MERIFSPLMKTKMKWVFVVTFYLYYAMAVEEDFLTRNNNNYCFELESEYKYFFLNASYSNNSRFYFSKFEKKPSCKYIANIIMRSHRVPINESCNDINADLADPALPVTKINLKIPLMILDYRIATVNNYTNIIFEFVSDNVSSLIQFSPLKFEDEDNFINQKFKPKDVVNMFQYKVNEMKYCGLFLEGNCANFCFSINDKYGYEKEKMENSKLFVDEKEVEEIGGSGIEKNANFKPVDTFSLRGRDLANKNLVDTTTADFGIIKPIGIDNGVLSAPKEKNKQKYFPVSEYCVELETEDKHFFVNTSDENIFGFHFLKLEKSQCKSIGVGGVRIKPHSVQMNESCIISETYSEVQTFQVTTKSILDKPHMTVIYKITRIPPPVKIKFKLTRNNIQTVIPYSFLKFENQNFTKQMFHARDLWRTFHYIANQGKLCGFIMNGNCAKFCFSRIAEDDDGGHDKKDGEEEEQAEEEKEKEKVEEEEEKEEEEEEEAKKEKQVEEEEEKEEEEGGGEKEEEEEEGERNVKSVNSKPEDTLSLNGRGLANKSLVDTTTADFGIIKSIGIEDSGLSTSKDKNKQKYFPVSEYCVELETEDKHFFVNTSDENIFRFHFLKLEKSQCKSIGVGGVRIKPHSVQMNENCIISETYFAVQTFQATTRSILDKPHMTILYRIKRLFSPIKINFRLISNNIQTVIPYSFLKFENQNFTNEMFHATKSSKLFQYIADQGKFCGFIIKGNCAKFCFSRVAEDDDGGHDKNDDEVEEGEEKEEEEEEEEEEGERNLKSVNSKPEDTFSLNGRGLANKSLVDFTTAHFEVTRSSEIDSRVVSMPENKIKTQQTIAMRDYCVELETEDKQFFFNTSDESIFRLYFLRMERPHCKSIGVGGIRISPKYVQINENCNISETGSTVQAFPVFTTSILDKPHMDIDYKISIIPSPVKINLKLLSDTLLTVIPFSFLKFENENSTKQMFHERDYKKRFQFIAADRGKFCGLIIKGNCAKFCFSKEGEYDDIGYDKKELEEKEEKEEEEKDEKEEEEEEEEELKNKTSLSANGKNFEKKCLVTGTILLIPLSIYFRLF